MFTFFDSVLFTRVFPRVLQATCAQPAFFLAVGGVSNLHLESRLPKTYLAKINTLHGGLRGVAFRACVQESISPVSTSGQLFAPKRIAGVDNYPDAQRWPCGPRCPSALEPAFKRPPTPTFTFK